MWNPFARKKAAPPPPDRVQELANRLARENRAAELERALEALDIAALSAAEQESWWHLYGITALRDGRDALALERFSQAYARFPRSAHIRFSLGQSPQFRTTSVIIGSADKIITDVVLN